MNQLVHRLFEAQHLKQIKHEGWRLAGVQFPDSVAEHALVAAQIGRCLAVLEWADPYRVVTTLVFHDLAETRIGDLHRIATRYLHGKKEAEQQIFAEQLADIPWADELHELLEHFEAKTDLIGIVAKDADYLEAAFQAKIYVEQGYSAAQDRIVNIGKALRTQSAQTLRKELQEVKSTDRWIGLKKLS